MHLKTISQMGPSTNLNFGNSSSEDYHHKHPNAHKTHLSVISQHMAGSGGNGAGSQTIPSPLLKFAQRPLHNQSMSPHIQNNQSRITATNYDSTPKRQDNLIH